VTSYSFDDLIDDALEATVVLSFSRLGYELRRRLDHWPALPREGLAGKTALVTGPTSGLGRVTAVGLAQLGARLVLVGRNEHKLDALRRDLAALTGADRYRTVVADLSSLASVRGAVAEIRESETRLDVVVDNAGAIYPDRGETDEGIERTLAVLVAGPFVLESGLMPLLRQTPGARVISVTSGGMYAQRVHFDDLEWRSRTFNGTAAYAQAKRIQVALMREFARRFSATGVSFNAMHPGWADTPGLAEALPGFRGAMKPLLRTPEQGADTILWLATTPRVRPPGGRLYLDRRPRLFDRVPQTRLDAEDRVELWETISDLTGENPEATPA
jgi:NAD(P)-dependent dehydrogenase (short-subunit alcohol dehydrogenase family)